MRAPGKSDASYLLFFFVALIALGSAVLSLPCAWGGSEARPGRLPYVDALFTATSAVCVTGLATVDTAGFTRFGQAAIVVLIQLGGLGIVAFMSVMLLVPGTRLPFRRQKTLRSFSLDGVERDPAKIVRDIVFFTIGIEAVGAAALYPFMSRAAPGDGLFLSVFHSVSAFCNAGFSPFPDSLERFKSEPALLFVFAALIVSGGIGFIVFQDLAKLARRRKAKLSYHTRLMLSLTAALIVTGAAAFWILESDGVLAGMAPGAKAANALFQSITPRTAGFNAVHQAELGLPSQLVTVALMFIGGAPGSIAGGVKIATAYVVALSVARRPNEQGEINAFGRRLAQDTIGAATSYVVKAAALVALSAWLVCLFESSRGVGLGQALFEATSAFGTVGLSLDITAGLCSQSKLVLIGTMFSGRVGLVALEFSARVNPSAQIIHPEADILLG